MSNRVIKYADINQNDVVNGEGICVSYWTQGCPHRCKGCHNPETWDFNSGKEEYSDILVEKIINSIEKNNIKRNVSILGGEPLCPQNREFVSELVSSIRELYSDIDIYLWTGYTLDYLEKIEDKYINNILNNITYIIDGPYIESQRDITLKLRGSTNQNITKLN